MQLPRNTGTRARASPAPTIGDIVGAYKSLVSNECLKTFRSRYEITWSFSYFVTASYAVPNVYLTTHAGGKTKLFLNNGLNQKMNIWVNYGNEIITNMLSAMMMK
jgi:hypothetical protein